MDELVLKAMERWPNVPAVYGWLRLDRRGRWMLVDRGMPGFDESLHGAGSEITSPQIVDFIGRNYDSDAEGRWYWQNGPQRVFVDLEVAPWILRVIGSGPGARLATHTGEPVSTVTAAWRTDEGDLLLETEHGIAALHDLDLAALDIEEDDDADGAATLTICGRTLRVESLDRPLPFQRRPRG